MEWLVIVGIWLILSAAIGSWAGRKGKNAAAYFALSLLLSPLVGLVITAISEPDLKALAIQGKLKRCPECAEYIRPDATRCRFCGHEFNPAEAQPEATPVVTAPIRVPISDRDKLAWVTLLAVITAVVVLGLIASLTK